MTISVFCPHCHKETPLKILQSNEELRRHLLRCEKCKELWYYYEEMDINEVEMGLGVVEHHEVRPL